MTCIRLSTKKLLEEGSAMLPLQRFCATARSALTSTARLFHPSQLPTFSIGQSDKILQTLGANDALLQLNRTASDKMVRIITSDMVQGMAKGTLNKEDWDTKYMKADVLYIYNLGQALTKRAENESEKDRSTMVELATMFLGYGKHFERLKKYGLSHNDILMSHECNEHIKFLSKEVSIKEFYVAILTDMVPYVVFANHLLHTIDPLSKNPWIEYAKKYGDLNSKYAKGRLAKIIEIANPILENNEVDSGTAEKLFEKGFAFEEWFIRNAFSTGFTIEHVRAGQN